MNLQSGGLSWTHVRVPRLLSRVALGTYAGAAVFSMVAVFSHAGPLFYLAGSMGTLAMWPLFIASYVMSLTQSWIRGTIDVGEKSIVVQRGGRVREIPRAAVSSALVVERPVGGGRIATVEIELTDGDRLVARAPDLASARAVVDALGFGPSGRRATITLALPTRRLLNPLLGLVAYVLSSMVAASIGFIDGSHSGANWWPALYFAHPAVAVAVYLGLKRLTRSPTVTIGDDGVLVAGARRRFVPRRAISAISRVRGAPLFIGMRDGPHAVVRGALVDHDRLDAVGRLLEERHGPSAAAPERFTAFERGGSSLAEWKERLRATIDRSGYRDAASSLDAAGVIVRSPHATPDQRLGAALALRIAGEPPEKIRVAAGAVVDDDVRGALEAIAEDDDARTEKALRRVR